MLKLLRNLKLLIDSNFFPNKKTVSLFISLTLIGGFLKIFSIVSLLPLLEKVTNITSNTENFFVKNINNFFELLSIDKNFISIATLIVVLLLTKFLIDMLSVKFFEKTMVNLSFQIRKSLTKSLFRLDFESFEKIKNNELISIFQEQIIRVRNFFRNSMNFITHLIETTIFLSSSFLINFYLTLFAIFLGISKFFILNRVHTLNQKLGKELTKRQMHDNKSIIDTLSSMKFLRFMNKEKFGSNKIITSQINLDEVTRKNNVLFFFLKNINELLNLMFLGIFLAYGYSISNNINELIILIIFLNKALSVISQIQKTVYKMETAYDAVNIINQNLNKWEQGNYFTGKKIIKDFNSIELKNVTIKSSKKNLFKNLNLKLLSNKIYKVTGDSGVGKTIFIESLLGLRKIHLGKILIGGNILEYNKINLGNWFSQIGYISNNPTFFDDTLFENIKLGSTEISNNSIHNYLDELELKNAFQKNELIEKIELDPKNTGLSLGQSQRIQIIRGILHSKRILFIDEGLSNIELELRNKILNLLSKLKKKLTIFIISHNMNENKFIDYNIKISNGMIKLKKIK